VRGRIWRPGKSLGNSGWDGADGVVSTVIEYGENGRPSKIWNESGAITAYAYDGCERLTSLSDSTGQELSVAYDENGNVTELTASDPSGRKRTLVSLSFDAMDRIETRQSNGGTPERFQYNALGAIVAYTGRSGLTVKHTHDALGRHTGHAYALTDAGRETVQDRTARSRTRAVRPLGLATLKAPSDQTQVVRQYEYNDNYRLVAYIDAAEVRTIYKYDELNRQASVVYPDGSSARVAYNARGSVVRVVDANGHQTGNSYDATGRLIETVDSSGRSLRYQYDGAGRLLAALGGEKICRTYDSLSNVRTEVQRLGTVRFKHDSAGNLSTLTFAKSLIVADCKLHGGRLCRKMPRDRYGSTKRQATAAYPHTCARLSVIQETMIADWALSDLRMPALRRNRLRDIRVKILGNFSKLGN
jgi:YD repeat-containing protein